MKVTFVGMTHLGLVSAVGAAAKGHHVLCYDCNPQLIAQLSQGTIPFVEPHLQESLIQHRTKITFSCDVQDLSKEQLIYIAPDIPTNDCGESDLFSIQSLLETILPHLYSQAIVVIHSQVSPGFCRNISWPHLYYHVETLIFGQALNRATQPERFIIGSKDPQKPLPKLFSNYLESYACPILVMNYESAELTKISINLFLIASVSTTNTIAGLCEKIGAKWDEIAGALKLDKRIGKDAYLAPGLGIAGGNLERDMATFCRLADQHGADCSLIRNWQHLSKQAALWTLKKLHAKHVLNSPDAKIAILGLAYKKDTSSIKNSPSIALLKYLRNYQVRAYDPSVKTTSEKHVKLMHSSYEAMDGADVLIVMTPWDEFKTLTPSETSSRMRGKTIIDPYGVLPKAFDTLNYVKLGE